MTSTVPAFAQSQSTPYAFRALLFDSAGELVDAFEFWAATPGEALSDIAEALTTSLAAPTLLAGGRVELALSPESANSEEITR